MTTTGLLPELDGGGAGGELSEVRAQTLVEAGHAHSGRRRWRPVQKRSKESAEKPVYFTQATFRTKKAKSSHQKSFREIARYQSLPRPAMLRAALLLLLGSPSVALLRPASHAALLRPTARPAVTMAGFGAPPAQGGKKVKKGGKSGAKSKSGGPPAKELLPKKN